MECVAPGIPFTFQLVVVIRRMFDSSFIAAVNDISYVIREGLCRIGCRSRPTLLVPSHRSHVNGEGAGWGCGSSSTVAWST